MLLKVAGAGNLRVAAEMLGVTRSAVSQSLGKLEGTLGIALDHRATRSVRLTEAGRRWRASLMFPAGQQRGGAPGQDQADGVGSEGSVLDFLPPVHFAEHRPIARDGGAEPVLEGAHWA